MHRRWLFDRIGYFDETLICNHDDEFYPAPGKQAPHVERARARVRVLQPPSLTVFSRQHFDYGRWRAATLANYGTVASPAQIAPPDRRPYCRRERAATAAAGPGRCRRRAVLDNLAAGTVREARRGAGPVETR